MTKNFEKIHAEALLVAGRYRKCEVELLEILQQVDAHRVYYKKGYPSLFKYAVEALKLSEAVAYIFINVARKSVLVPSLKEEIKKGAISVSKAKKIAAVINVENSEHWLELARTRSQARLEREVAKVSSKAQMKYVHPDDEIKEAVRLGVRAQLMFGISEELMLNLRRAQDVLSSKKKCPVGLEEVLEVMTDLLLEKYDPVAKARRQKMRGKLQDEARAEPKQEPVMPKQTPPTKMVSRPVRNWRAAIPARIKHQVLLRDPSVSEPAGLRLTRDSVLTVKPTVNAAARSGS